MAKLRLSYSLLNIWGRGDVDGAVQTYFHLNKPATRQMKEGRRIHKDIADHVEKFNTFPEWLNFKYDLALPESEKEVVAEYNEMFDLKGFFDCYDTVDKTVFEYKSGVSDSLEWARTDQLPFYFLIAELLGLEIDRGILIHFNQYTESTDFCIVHNSSSKRERARNLIDSEGPSIYDFFDKQGFI